MQIPARILRRMAQDRDPHPIFLTERQIRCRERILVLGQYLMAQFGRQAITFSNFATALRIGRTTLRFHFPDLDALLGDILREHLMKLSSAMGDIPQEAPDRQQARRAAYLAYTRRPFGGLTEAHLLLVRDRHLLPPDELESIELMRQGLGDLLAGDLAEEALLLLDAHALDAARIEARLAIPGPDRRPQNASPALAGEEGAQPARAAKVRVPRSAPEIRPPAKGLARPKPVLFPASSPNPGPADPPYPTEKPGDWIYSAGIPGVARAPPAAA